MSTPLENAPGSEPPGATLNVTRLTWQEAKELQVHKTAQALPRLLPEEFAELKHDVALHGLREQVLVNRRKDTILDGRHRRKACVELKADMPVEVYQGQDEKDEIIARALYRRHMTDDQRLAFVIEVCLGEVRRRAQERIIEARHRMALAKTTKPIHTDVEIAKKAGVSPRKARRAIEATDRDPKAVKEIKEGKKRWREVTKPKPTPTPEPKSAKPRTREAIWNWFGDRVKAFFHAKTDRDVKPAMVTVIKALVDDEALGGEPVLKYPNGEERSLRQQLGGDRKGTA
jgi:hypothetical protein